MRKLELILLMSRKRLNTELPFFLSPHASSSLDDKVTKTNVGQILIYTSHWNHRKLHFATLSLQDWTTQGTPSEGILG